MIRQLPSYVDYCVATVLTACGIETTKREFNVTDNYVATVLTACGIETLQLTPLQ